MKNKRVYFFVWMILLSIVLCFSVAEITINFYNFHCKRHRPFWLPDKYLGYKHASNNWFIYYKNSKGEGIAITHKTNSMGFLGDDIPLEKPRDVIRIAILGDSFTEAFQVSERNNFCSLLEKKLNERFPIAGKRYEVINAGVSGYSPISEFQFYRKVVSKFKPDRVIVQLFANDVYEDHKAAAMGVLDDQGYPILLSRFFTKKYQKFSALKDKTGINRETMSEKFLNFLIERSRFIEYMYVKIIGARKNSAYNERMHKKEEFDDANIFFIIDQKKLLFYHQAVVDKAWGETQKYLLAIKNAVEKDGASFSMFYIPLQCQLVRNTCFGQRGGPSMGTRFNELLAVFAKEHDIPFVDILPVFDEFRYDYIYLVPDGHLNEYSHQLVSEELVSLFQKGDSALFETKNEK